jgi:hypothetical protein
MSRMLAAVKTTTVTNEDGERETWFAGKSQTEPRQARLARLSRSDRVA